MGIPAPYKFPTISADGNSTTVAWPGGRGVFAAFGNFGGGTVTLQQSPDDGTTWINVDRTGDTYVTFTANGQGGFELGKCLLRVNMAGSTTPAVQSGVEHANQ